MPTYQFHRVQKLPVSPARLWDYIATPANLQAITPAYLKFRIRSVLPEKMYAGLIIQYRICPLPGIPMDWVTEITHIREHEYFVDEQRTGPYSLWHHQHHLREIEGGTLMSDIVTYRPPLGIIGALANAIYIERELEKIFDYRFKVLEKVFSKFDQQEVLIHNKVGSGGL